MKEAKRVELLPEVIEKCINKNLNIEFNIAGEGECQDLLRSYISEKHLENKVHMLGSDISNGNDKFLERTR